MEAMAASEAKQRFGELLEMAAQSPVSITRHGQVVAIVAPPGGPDPQHLERRLARRQQELVEASRLIRHQRIAVQLLAEPQEAPSRIAEAQAVVQHWEREHTCSPDFIERWRALLALPLPALATALCGDAEGWGAALRQNSPWVGMP